MKKKTVGSVKRKAWTAFSLWVRNRDRGVCFTCGGNGNQAGHYIPRSLSSFLYFNEDNVHAQCFRCNINLFGNSDEYAARLGEEVVKRLRADKTKHKQWSIKELEELIAKYDTPST